MAAKARSAAQKAAAESAIRSIGLGYDLTVDLRLKYCKASSSSPDSRLIAIGDRFVREIAIPGGVCIPNVPKSINCDKGERMRFGSDVLSFQQVRCFASFLLAAPLTLSLYIYWSMFHLQNIQK